MKRIIGTPGARLGALVMALAAVACSSPTTPPAETGDDGGGSTVTKPKPTKTAAPGGTPTPAAGGTPTPTPTPAGTPTATPTPDAAGTATPTPAPAGSGTPGPSASPTATPSAAGSGSPSPSPTPTAGASTPTPAPTPTPLLLTTLAGTGAAGKNDGPGASATFDGPTAIAVHALEESAKYLVVADTGNNVLRKVDRVSGQTTVFAGSGAAGKGDNGSDPLLASFFRPEGVAIATDGTIYVADTGNHLIRKITYNAGAANRFVGVTTLAGSASGAGFADGDGTSAQFNEPRGLALSADGKRLYVADTVNRRIRVIKLDTAGPAVTTIAGNGETGENDGTGNVARFRSPWALTVSGNALIVVDKDVQRIRQVVKIADAVASTAEVSLYVGSGTPGLVEQDQSASGWDFSPAGGAIFLGPNLNYFIAETGNQRIRLHSDNLGSRTLAGSGDRAGSTAVAGGSINGSPVVGGFKDGPLTAGAVADRGRLNNPQGVVFWGDLKNGVVYVSDTANNRIRSFPTKDLPDPFGP